MAIKTPKETVLQNDDPVISTTVSKNLKQASLINADVATTEIETHRTLYQDSTGIVDSGTPVPSQVDIVRSPDDNGEIVSVYKTDGDIYVTNLEQIYRQQFTYATGENGVEQILAGTNVTISSTGPAGTGIVTINAAGATTAGVTRIIAGNNIAVTSTLPDGTGNVTIDSTLSLIDTYANISGATGVVVHNYALGPVFYHQNVAANFTVNLTNFSLNGSQTTGITVTIQQGAIAYIPNAFQIAGVPQTINWQGGVVPTGNPNKTDFVGFTFFGTGSGYRVYGQLVTFG
jgi:hypothetical protein